MRKRKPAKQENELRPSSVALKKGRLRKKRRSTRGSRRRGSYRTKATRDIAAGVKSPRINRECHPACGPSITPHVRVESPIRTRACPTGSKDPARAAFDSGPEP